MRLSTLSGQINLMINGPVAKYKWRRKIADKYDLRGWLIAALKSNGNKGTIIDVCKFIWDEF